MVALVALVALAASPGPAPATLVALHDLNDHGPLLAKDDGPADPVTIEDRTQISALGPVFVAGAEGGRARPVIHTWGTTIRARAIVALAGRRPARPELFSLVGQSSVRALSFVSGPGRPAPDGRGIVFELMARAPLPAEIALVEGEIRWRLERRYRRPLDCGRTAHTVLVTAGPPLAATSWPIRGAGGGDDDPSAEDHNAPTLFRLRAAVATARGATTATAAAARAWRAAVARFSLDADPEVNPWDLPAGAWGQCMSTASLIESMVALLGFSGGSVVYVYPSLGPPRAPGARAFPHPLIPGAFTVESTSYDARGQLRRVAADPAHAGRAALLHRGGHGVERLKMRDFRGGLHNYAAAFVIEEAGVRSYFGGGYSAGPYHDAASFLGAACTAAVWAHEGDEPDTWDAVCDVPGAGYWWDSGRFFTTADARADAAVTVGSNVSSPR